MTIRLGNTPINKVMLGSTEVKKAHLGSTLLHDTTGGGGGAVTAPTFVGIGTFEKEFGNLNLVAPAHQANDIGVIIAGHRGNDIPVTPTGYTALAAVTDGLNDGPLQILYWRRAANASDLDVTLLDAGNVNHGAIAVFRGCPTGPTPISLLGSGNMQSAVTAASIAGQSSTQANSLILGVISQINDTVVPDLSGGFTNGDLSGVATRFSSASDKGSGNGLYGFTGLKATAGAFGASAATMTTAANLANAHYEIMGV